MLAWKLAEDLRSGAMPLGSCAQPLLLFQSIESSNLVYYCRNLLSSSCAGKWLSVLWSMDDHRPFGVQESCLFSAARQCDHPQHKMDLPTLSRPVEIRIPLPLLAHQWIPKQNERLVPMLPQICNQVYSHGRISTKYLTLEINSTDFWVNIAEFRSSKGDAGARRSH